MKVEFEAKFSAINKETMRNILRSKGATLVKKEFLQKRSVFNLPKGNEITGGWLRVRDEEDKVTLSLKVVRGNESIEDQREIELKVDNYDQACELLETIGCLKKAYQESLREKWSMEEATVTLDEWPYLEPFIEIEADSESLVKEVSRKLAFDYSLAYFGAVDGLYAKKYGISMERINNFTPEILFNMSKNPFEV